MKKYLVLLLVLFTIISNSEVFSEDEFYLQELKKSIMSTSDEAKINNNASMLNFNCSKYDSTENKDFTKWWDSSFINQWDVLNKEILEAFNANHTIEYVVNIYIEVKFRPDIDPTLPEGENLIQYSPVEKILQYRLVTTQAPNLVKNFLVLSQLGCLDNSEFNWSTKLGYFNLLELGQTFLQYNSPYFINEKPGTFSQKVKQSIGEDSGIKSNLGGVLDKQPLLASSPLYSLVGIPVAGFDSKSLTLFGTSVGINLNSSREDELPYNKTVFIGYPDPCGETDCILTEELEKILTGKKYSDLFVKNIVIKNVTITEKIKIPIVRAKFPKPNWK